MVSHPIPDDVRQFILDKIDSVAQLEALLLLRANPSDDWDAAEVAKRLYVDEEQARTVLARLLEEKLLAASTAEPPRFHYQPVSSELREMVNRIAEVYSKHLVPVTNLIHSKPRSRVQEFADAFKFRKDD
jgi:predicted ArsR family transcriptional regulator